MALDLIAAPMDGEHDTAIATATNKLSFLGHLAAEIHIEIAKKLEKEDLRSLRCASRSLGKDTFDVFAEKNFMNLSCRFTRQSLENVRDISATPHFVQHVKTITFHAGSYKTELSWPGLISEVVFDDLGRPAHKVVQVRAREANDTLLEDIFSNLARSGSARCIALNTTQEFLNPALHTVAIALTTSGHFVEELRCSIEAHVRHMWGPPGRLYDKKLDNVEFPRVAQDTWSKLRAIKVHHPGNGNSSSYVDFALSSTIRVACGVEELTLQVPSDKYLNGISRALTSHHNLRTLKIFGNEDEIVFGNHQLQAMLCQVKRSLKKLVLADMKLSGEHWTETLEWVSRAMSLRHLSCQNLRTIDLPGVPSWLLLDGEGNPQFEVKGSEEQVREGLSALVAEVGDRLEFEISLSEWLDE